MVKAWIPYLCLQVYVSFLKVIERLLGHDIRLPLKKHSSRWEAFKQKRKIRNKKNSIQIQDRELGMHVDHLKFFEFVVKEIEYILNRIALESRRKWGSLVFIYTKQTLNNNITRPKTSGHKHAKVGQLLILAQKIKIGKK